MFNNRTVDPRTIIVAAFVAIITLIIFVSGIFENKKINKKFKLKIIKENQISIPIIMTYLGRFSHTETDDIRNSLFPLRLINEELMLIRDHCLSNKRCYECITKHFMNIEALCDYGQIISHIHGENYGRLSNACRQILLQIRKNGVKAEETRRTIDDLNEIIDEINEKYDRLLFELGSFELIKERYDENHIVPLRNALFNLREIIKNIQMLELFTGNDAYRCVTCLKPFFTQITALCHEGIQMANDNTIKEYYKTIGNQMIDIMGDINDYGIDDDTSQEFRTLRKKINNDFKNIHEKALLSNENFYEPKFTVGCAATCSE